MAFKENSVSVLRSFQKLIDLQGSFWRFEMVTTSSPESLPQSASCSRHLLICGDSGDGTFIYLLIERHPPFRSVGGFFNSLQFCRQPRLSRVGLFFAR